MGRLTREERFEGIYQRDAESVRAYVRRRAPADVVDDVVADTFVVCWRRLDRVPEVELPWLYAVARRVLANERRKRGRMAEAAVAGPAFVEPEAEGDPVLAAAFACLGERDREVLCLVAWEGLTLARAAAVLGCSRVACRVRFHRARRRLAAGLGDRQPATVAARQPRPEGASR